MANIRTVVVIGAGNMGSGIAQSCATAGFATTMVDLNPEFVEKGMGRIKAPLEKRIAAGKMERKELDRILSNLEGSTDVAASAREADLIIEAVFEEYAVKEDLFRRVAQTGTNAIVATNTSSLSVARLAKAFGDPARFGGLHYFFPAAINKLVEVIAGPDTSPETFETLWDFALRQNKIPIRTADAAGFCVNRFFVPLLNEACRLLEEKVADVPTIEAAANEVFGTTMGPFQLMNVTGIPIAHHAMGTLHAAFGAFYEPARLLKAQVEKKTDWDLQGAADRSRMAGVKERLRGVAFGIACHLVEEGVASREDTDRGAVVGLRWRAGPFELMNELGLVESLAAVKSVNERWKSAFPLPESLQEHAKASRSWDLRTLEVSMEGHVAILRIARPESLNALSPKVLADLEDALVRAEADRDVRAVILTGTGRSFVAGADIKTMAEQSAIESLAFTQQGQRVVRRIELMAKPVVAAVNGFAFGGGCELALACDIILAAQSAQFALPEVGLGIHPGFGGTQRLPRAIGPLRAKEWIFTGERFSAEAAAAAGLVNKVVPDAELLTEARRIARRIAEQAPMAVGLAKGVINRGLGTDLGSGLALETQSVTLTFATQDQKEGMRAFLERRKPDFKGK